MCFFFPLQAQRSPNSEGQQPKTQGLPQTRARTGAPPTDARSESSGKRQQRQHRLARTKEANATTHRRPYTARQPLAEPNTGRAGTCAVHMKARRPKTSRAPGGALYKEGPKPKRTQRPKRARSRKGWPNCKKSTQHAQRLRMDRSTTQATLPRRKPYIECKWTTGARGRKPSQGRRYPIQQPTPGPSAKRMGHAQGNQNPPTTRTRRSPPTQPNRERGANSK